MNKIKFSKAILTIAFLAILTWGFSANTPIAKAATVEELLAQITALQTQIAQLQQQLAELQGKPAVWCHDFNANLRYGDRFGDVGYLQTALEKEGFKISEDEKMRNYFGDFTASAVVGFQEKYREDILAPWGLEHGTGFVGKTTRAKLNAIYGCVVIKSITVISPNGGETWVVGNTYDIRWESRKIEKVRITLETTEPSVRVLPILIVDDYPANLGKYSWVVEDFPGRWKIKIIGKTADGRVVSDLSDNYFSIVSAIPTILYKTEWDGAKLTTTLLRSDDGGKTWKAIMSQYKGGITYATDSKNPKIIYAGDTGGNLMAEYLDIDLVKSTNGGDTWVDISKGVFYDVCQRIVCSQKIEGN